MEFLIFIALVVIAGMLFLIQQKLNDIWKVLQGLLSQKTAKEDGDIKKVPSAQEDEGSSGGGGGPK